MNSAGRRLTIRMPDNHGQLGAEVVGVHVDPGGRVREGSPVVTVRSAEGDHAVHAPRPGLAVPLVSAGDRVLGGDPLFLLDLDERALRSAKARSGRGILRRGIEVFTAARRGSLSGMRPVRHWHLRRADRPVPEAESSGWLKPGLAMLVVVIAAFALLPVFRTMDIGPGWPDLVAIVGLALAVPMLIAIFLMPSRGFLPRMTVRLISITWLVLAAAALYPRLVLYVP